MTLKNDTSRWMERIQAAEAHRDAHLPNYDEMVEKYHTRHYHEGTRRKEITRENHYHDWLSLVVPKLVFDNPRVRTTTRLPGSQEEVAAGIGAGLNRIVKDISFARQLAEGPAVDMQFNWGVMMVRNEERKGARAMVSKDGKGPDRADLTDPEGQRRIPNRPYGPTCQRIDQRRFVQDPNATCREEVRWQGHRVVADKEDLIAKARRDPKKWDLAAIEALQTGAEAKALGRPPQHALEENEVTYYEVFVPEYGSGKKGMNGKILTIPGIDTPHGQGKEARALRPGRDYYGPVEGPYEVFGSYKVPGKLWPLGSLTVIEDQIRDVNDHATATSESARSYKRLILVAKTNPRLQQIIKNARDSFVIPVDGLENVGQQVIQIELGGASAQQFQYLEYARNRLDRGSSLSEALRGQAGSGTATANQIASDAAQTRFGMLVKNFNDSAVRILRRFAWYMYHDNRIAFPLGKELGEELLERLGAAPEVIQGPGGETLALPPDLWFYGGRHDAKAGYTFEDLEIDIELYSMTRTNEGVQQQNMMQALQIVTQMAPMIAQFPFIAWERIFQKLGDSMNMPDFHKFVDIKAAAAMAGVQPIAGETQPKVVQPGAAQPAGGGMAGGQGQGTQLGMGAAMAIPGAA